jgi:hypothetical protein
MKLLTIKSLGNFLQNSVEYINILNRLNFKQKLNIILKY